MAGRHLPGSCTVRKLLRGRTWTCCVIDSSHSEQILGSVKDACRIPDLQLASGWPWQTLPAATAAPGPHRDNDRRKPCCHDTASFLCDLNCQAPGPAGRPGWARPVGGLRPLPAPGPDSDSDPTERPAALMPPRPLSDAMPVKSRTVPR